MLRTTLVYLSLLLLPATGFTEAASTSAPVIALGSANKGNIFLADEGEMILTLTKNSEGAHGTVTLTDENGDELDRWDIPKDQATIPILLPEKGFYRVMATVTNTANQTTTTEATAAVIGPELDEAVRMNSHLGIWNVNGDSDMMAIAGARYNRKMMSLRNYEKDFLRFDDPAVDPEPPAPPAKPEAKLTKVGVFSFGLPYWLTGRSEEDNKRHFGKPTSAPLDWDELSTLVRAYVRNPPLPEFPQYVEVYNEPEWQWEGSDEDFVRFLATVADAIKEVRPDVQVLGPGFSQVRLEDSNRIGLERAYEMGLLDHFDGIVLHCYVDGSAPEGQFIQNIIDLKAFLKRIGKDDMPLHFTEFGWTTVAGTWQRPVDELTQAQYVVRSLTLLSAMGVDNATYFCYINNSWNQGERGFSIAHKDATPKPAYAAYAQVAHWLADIKGEAHWLRITPSVNLVLFDKDEEYVAVLWDTGGESRFTLPGHPSKIEDMTGGGVVLPANGEVVLSPSPLFISWPKSEDFQVTEAPVLTLMRGNAVDLGTSPKAGWLVPAHMHVKGDQLSAPSETPIGPYLLLAQTENGWLTQPLEVIAPLMVSAPKLSWPADSPEPILSAEAESFASGLLDIRDSARVSGLRTFFGEPTQIDESETRELSIPLPGLSLGKRYQGEFEVVSVGSGQRDRFVHPFSFTVLACEPTTSLTPAWSSIPAIDFSDWAPYGDSFTADDCSATLQSSYSDRGLYLRVQVRDDNHQQEATPEKMWSQDAIQIGLDIDIDKPWNANEFHGLKGHRVFEYGVGGNPGNVMTWRWISYLQDLPSGQSEPRLKTSIERSGGVTTYNIFFPWEILGARTAPKAGSSIGIALAVSDADTGEANKRRGLTLFSGIVDKKDPEEFGHLWLR